jgi:hypothetical protein
MFVAACIEVTRSALRKADEFTKKVPLPAIVKQHISKKDAAFIAAAYAIPLPGTGLFAAAIVGGKLSCRLLRSRLKCRPTVDTSNG